MTKTTTAVLRCRTGRIPAALWRLMARTRRGAALAAVGVLLNLAGCAQERALRVSLRPSPENAKRLYLAGTPVAEFAYEYGGSESASMEAWWELDYGKDVYRSPPSTVRLRGGSPFAIRLPQGWFMAGYRFDQIDADPPRTRIVADVLSQETAAGHMSRVLGGTWTFFTASDFAPEARLVSPGVPVRLWEQELTCHDCDEAGTVKREPDAVLSLMVQLVLDNESATGREQR